MGSNNSILEVFKSVDLKINADVTVVISEGTVNYTKGGIYDVYNPYFSQGGTLRVNRIGSYDETEGYHTKVDDGKYLSRKNLTGVSFKSLIVVGIN